MLTVVRLRNVYKKYTIGSQAVVALGGVDLDVQRGEYLAIKGSSGSGKSTLLNILGILDSPDSGKYSLAGEMVSTLSVSKAAHFRSRHLGFVFQSFNLISHKSALENVALPLFYQGIAKKSRFSVASALLERVGLGDRADHRPSELSGGQSQRVAIARALVTNPAMILADEPTGALDSSTSYQIMELLREANDSGVTLILVTHDEDIAANATRTIEMRDGLIVADTDRFHDF